MSKSSEIKSQDVKARNVAYRGYKDGSVEFFGEQVEILTGYTKEEFNLKKVIWTDLILDADKEQTKEAFKQALKTDKTYMREYRIRSRSGELKWMREWGQIVCDENGDIEFILGILVDINEQKRIEETHLKSEQRTGKYLTFSMADEDYGIGILSVREIIGIMPITTVPHTPEFIKGVINLRGKVIPVIDLRLRFGIEEIDYTEETCIIVVEIQRQEGQIVIGIIVDSVSEVLPIQGSQIEDAPTFGTQSEMDFILGMARIEEGVKILLDTGRFLSGEDIKSIKKAG
jgi:purine-binding chemotaxis protein CheW